MMAAHFKGDNKINFGLTGAINLILVGLCGVIFGYFIDRTVKYKTVSAGLILTMTVLYTFYSLLEVLLLIWS